MRHDKFSVPSPKCIYSDSSDGIVCFVIIMASTDLTFYLTICTNPFNQFIPYQLNEQSNNNFYNQATSSKVTTIVMCTIIKHEQRRKYCAIL